MASLGCCNDFVDPLNRNRTARLVVDLGSYVVVGNEVGYERRSYLWGYLGRETDYEIPHPDEVNSFAKVEVEVLGAFDLVKNQPHDRISQVVSPVVVEVETVGGRLMGVPGVFGV